MAKRFCSAAELLALPRPGHVLPDILYSVRGPQPQMLLVVCCKNAPTVRTVTMTPLSWQPYTKAISVPVEDTAVFECLSRSGAECVLAEPTRYQLRQLTLCSQRWPAGLSITDICRFSTIRSLYVNVPSLADCPVNFECCVEHWEVYHGRMIAFLRVVGASIDPALLFWHREQIVSLFPTYDVDCIVDSNGRVVQRVGLMGDLFLCPTFPCAPKQGWYATFERWMQDLHEEGYLTQAECDRILGWYVRWQALFADLQSPERASLRLRLTRVCRLIAEEQWEDLHNMLSDGGNG